MFSMLLVTSEAIRLVTFVNPLVAVLKPVTTGDQALSLKFVVSQPGISKRRIVARTEQQITPLDGAVTGLPRTIADDRLRAAIGPLNDQLREESRRAAVKLPVPG